MRNSAISSGWRSIITATLCLYLAMPVSGARLGLLSAPLQEPQTSQSEAVQAQEDFRFTKVDLDLLEQVNLIDQRFARDGLVYENPNVSLYFQRVGESLLPRDLKLEHVTWKFRMLRDPVPNAFALPNGSIYVDTGLLALMDNESELAAVLAHEIMHVLGRHSYLTNRNMRKKILTLNIIAAVGAWTPGVAGAAIQLIAIISPFIAMSMIYGYSRELEKEADLKGTTLMMNAEYPPDEMVSMLKLLSNDLEGEQIKLFYNDHPQLKDRIGYVSNYLGGKANKPTAASELKREKNAYLREVEPVIAHDVQLAINAARFRTAVYLSEKLVQFRSTSPNLFWLAESYRTLGPRTAQLSDNELRDSAKKDAVKKREKRTPEEEEKDLLRTTEGQRLARENQQKAEGLYAEALKVDQPLPATHRGLGLLYEKSGRVREAIDEFQKYIELAPDAADRERIQRHIQILKGS